jgi:hypothetical protein
LSCIFSCIYVCNLNQSMLVASPATAISIWQCTQVMNFALSMKQMSLFFMHLS